ncbi:MAG TPA: dihydrofolate reductase [Pyrinomonadaceae bacterium]|jgi:dihydrofolate reductase|nr:dihydrofolate reductase [Pyrinomonadaceae bacterium]
MAVIGIVAIDAKGAIGKGGTLPWHYSADLKFFREQTTGHACVMGYRTWLSLKRPLPNRLNVVLTRRAEVGPRESVAWMRDRLSVIALRDYLRCDLYVIGGAQVFRDFAADIERWVVTRVPFEAEGADTFMPADFLEGFGPRDTRELEGGLKVTFYERPR